MNKIEIPHIGEVLNEEFLQPLGLSQNKLAKAIGVPQNRINAIINKQRGITADTDLRLTTYFGLSEGYFSGIQEDFDRIKTKREISSELKRIIPYANANENIPMNQEAV
ncbi:MAG: HigA family addiction module antitoxin [Alphaproteobacteria bacterium]